MSDTLGDLRLLLSAPSDKLLGDLNTADRLIASYDIKWANKFGQIAIGRGIASSLNTELLAADSALASTLR